jgi:hypothetical protein
MLNQLDVITQARRVRLQLATCCRVSLNLGWNILCPPEKKLSFNGRLAG